MNLTCLNPVYKIHERQFLPTSRSSAWEFLSNPTNLGKITPPEMDFQIVSGAETQMYPGQIITYHVRPMIGVKICWVSEITHVEAGRFFVDEQRIGPYRMWHHEHHLHEVPGGIDVEDTIHYVMPFGLLGAAMHHLFVKQQLRHIFNHRRITLQRIFANAL